MFGDRLKALTAASLCALLVGAATAHAQEPFGPYDGSNPFRCQLQDVGTGTDFPDPDADPFCVKFDKTSQNVTDFGVVDFLANEPARVAAAAPKCFYFQRDHWTGSIVQGEEPELWNWRGDYWFDKARGTGGVSVREFRVGGVPFDFTPFVPEAYRPYFDAEGGGGVQVLMDSIADPSCAERVDTAEERQAVYADAPRENGCIPPGGELRGRRVGRARLGVARRKLHERLGEPAGERNRVDRWCLIGDAQLRAAYVRRRVALLMSSSRGHDIREVAPGDRAGKARKRFGEAGSFKAGGSTVLHAGGDGGRDAWVGLRKGRVRWVALTDPNRLAGDAAARRALRRAR